MGIIKDVFLRGRVRTTLRKQTRHAPEIDIAAQNGTVTLTGPISRDELYLTLKKVSGLKGVSSILNNLDILEEPNVVSEYPK